MNYYGIITSNTTLVFPIIINLKTNFLEIISNFLEISEKPPATLSMNWNNMELI
jgi:hypothetical protein